MGCGEENLGKKTRRFGWKEAVGGLVAAVAVAGGVVWAYETGYNKRQAEIDACTDKNAAAYEEGIAETEAKYQDEWATGAVDTYNTNTEEFGPPGWGFTISRLGDNGERIVYSAGAAPEWLEAFSIYTQEGHIHYYDGSELLTMGGYNLFVFGEHDGQVDYIHKCENGECTLLLRNPGCKYLWEDLEREHSADVGENCVVWESDYEAHKEEFDAADAEFQRLRQWFNHR